MPIRILSDSNGCFFRYGKTGKKYYFKDKNEMASAYDQCLQQTRAIKSNGGSWYNPKDIYHALTGLRLNLPPSGRKLLEQIGDKTITNMLVCRTKLSLSKETIVNLMNLFVKHQPINDKLFHLFFVLTIDGKKYIFDKNEVVNIRPYNGSQIDESINVSPKGTLGELLNNAVNKFGKERVFRYSATQNNCQRFVCDCLDASNISFDRKFVLQDVSNVTNKTGSIVAQVATDLSHKWDIIKNGYGKNKMSSNTIGKMEDEFQQAGFEGVNYAGDDEYNNNFHLGHPENMKQRSSQEEPEIGKGKKSSPWIEHVKKVAKKNKITYREALKIASKSYKK